ncbi:magnesium and cobalt transport protein CorA [Corynebacterium pacaense]|uniref:magnesium and cobalt transport protein CorA n=1 Tax=Corynebacterium pacaense TaxID=1816684 RepID=UPI0011775AA7
MGKSGAERAGEHPRSGPQVPLERNIDYCRVFHEGRRLPGSWTPSAALEEVRANGGFLWLGLHRPTDEQMDKVADLFDLDELVVEDAVTARQRPKVERYEEQTFMVVRSVTYSDAESVQDSRQIIETGEFQMVIGKDFIITIRHGASMPDLDRRLNEDLELDTYSPFALAWTAADFMVEEYRRIATQLSDEVDRLEEEVFTPRARFDIEQIYMLKREILEMRHAIDPFAIALRSLISDHKDLLNKELRSYFRDVLDNESIAGDLVASFDERLSALIDAGVAKISLQQNSDMRAISAIVGMSAAPTMIAGVYGMNFDNMPELHTEYGYYIVLAIMVATVLGLYWFFKRHNWL